MRWLRRALRRWLLKEDVNEGVRGVLVNPQPVSMCTEADPWFVIRIYRADNGKIIDYYARATATSKTTNRLVIVPSEQPLPEALAVLMVKAEMGA